jgi:hypothetical protein
LLQSVYASRKVRDESLTGLGFGTSTLLSADPEYNRRVGNVSVSEVGFIFGLNTINDPNLDP